VVNPPQFPLHVLRFCSEAGPDSGPFTLHNWSPPDFRLRPPPPIPLSAAFQSSVLFPAADLVFFSSFSTVIEQPRHLFSPANLVCTLLPPHLRLIPPPSIHCQIWGKHFFFRAPEFFSVFFFSLSCLSFPPTTRKHVFFRTSFLRVVLACVACPPLIFGYFAQNLRCDRGFFSEPFSLLMHKVWTASPLAGSPPMFMLSSLGGSLFSSPSP